MKLMNRRRVPSNGKARRERRNGETAYGRNGVWRTGCGRLEAHSAEVNLA